MWALIIVSLIIIIVALAVEKKWYNAVVLFNGVWLVIYVLFQLQLFKTITLNEQTIAILMIQTVCFPLGAAAAMALQKKNRVLRLSGVERPRKRVAAYEIRGAVFWTLCAVTVLILLRDELPIMRMLLQGRSFQQIMWALGGKGTVEISGAVNVLLYLFIVHPMTGCISPICAVEFFSGKDKKRFAYFAVNVLIVMLAVVHHGGRNAMVQFALSYALCFFIMGKKLHMTKRMKRLVVIAAVAVMVLFGVVSSSRGIRQLWLSFYAYLIAALPLSTVYLDSKAVVPWTLGYTSFKGIAYPMMAVLNFLGLRSPQAYINSVAFKHFIEDHYFRIGDYSATGINSFLPAGLYWYVDGGYVLEIIGMFLYGFALRLVYQRYQRNADKRTLALLIMLRWALILSFMSLWFSSYHYAIGMLLLLFVIYGKSGKKIRMKL